MKVLDGQDDRGAEEERVLLVEVPDVPHGGEEVAPHQVLHEHVDAVLVLEGGDQAHNQRVAALGQDLALQPYRPLLVKVDHRLLPDALEREFGSRHGLQADAAHDAELPLAQHAAEKNVLLGEVHVAEPHLRGQLLVKDAARLHELVVVDRRQRAPRGPCRDVGVDGHAQQQLPGAERLQLPQGLGQLGATSQQDLPLDDEVVAIGELAGLHDRVFELVLLHLELVHDVLQHLLVEGAEREHGLEALLDAVPQQDPRQRRRLLRIAPQRAADLVVAGAADNSVGPRDQGLAHGAVLPEGGLPEDLAALQQPLHLRRGALLVPEGLGHRVRQLDLRVAVLRGRRAHDAVEVLRVLDGLAVPRVLGALGAGDAVVHDGDLALHDNHELRIGVRGHDDVPLSEWLVLEQGGHGHLLLRS
mmetsp:Transcript_8414/g.23732  ORF Transcript_8414/g.23732 Transcript_8414/m.23732 type:complete len:416 (-) Transcript_8414:1358-2605(-)